MKRLSCTILYKKGHLDFVQYLSKECKCDVESKFNAGRDQNITSSSKKKSINYTLLLRNVH